MVSLLVDCKRVIIQYDNYEDNCLIFGGHQKNIISKICIQIKSHYDYMHTTSLYS